MNLLAQLAAGPLLPAMRAAGLPLVTVAGIRPVWASAPSTAQQDAAAAMIAAALAELGLPPLPAVYDDPATQYCDWLPAAQTWHVWAPADYPALTVLQLRRWMARQEPPLTVADVDAVIATIPAPLARADAQAYWDCSLTFERQHPLLIQLATAMGFTPEALDRAFRAATLLTPTTPAPIA